MSKKVGLVLGIIVLLFGSFAYTVYSVSSNDVEASAPVVPQEMLDSMGFERTNSVNGTSSFDIANFKVLEAGQNTVFYNNRRLTQNINNQFTGDFDYSVYQFFSGRVVLNPRIDTIFGLKISPVINRVKSTAEKQFKQEMEDSGLKNIEKISEEPISIKTGENITLNIYEGVYPIEDLSFEVTSNEVITIQEDEIKVKALLATWHHNNSILIAGGVFPSENYKKTIQKNITEENEVEISIDLELTPNKYQEDLKKLIKNVK